MKMIISRTNKGKSVTIPKSLLSLSKLSEENELEFHAEENILVALPAKMTAMELINAVDALHNLAVDLSVHLACSCDHCGGCGMCLGMEDEFPVCVPPSVLEEAGLNPCCKLTACVDEDGSIRVEPAEYDYDIHDVPKHILDSMRQGGVCLIDLEDHLVREDVVYSAEKEGTFVCPSCLID